MSENSLIEIQIDRLSYDGGRGVGRYDGQVVFVPFSVPGDQLKCRVVEKHKTYLVAEIVEILSPSRFRVEAPCPVFGKCGGCRWQNVDYHTQLFEKKLFIEQALSELLSQETPIHMVGAAHPYEYRNRIQLHKKAGQIGYYAEKSHQLVAIEKCPIASGRINDSLSQLQEERYKDGKYELMERDQHVEIKDLSVKSLEFTQVNSQQNEKLRHQLMLGLEGLTPHYIYDFYCGSGNFTFLLGMAFPTAQIVAVESNDLSIGRALEKYEALRKGRLAKIHWFSADVGQFIDSVEPTQKTLTIVNPPRAGLQNSVIQRLTDLKPDTLAYVSCNLSTLARDLKKLKNIYEIRRVAGVDMFPQTEYIECVVHLSLKAI